MAKKQKTEWEITNENRAKTWKHLSPEQKEALKDLRVAWRDLQWSYAEFCHPNYGDLVKMDDACHKIYRVLFEEGK